MNERHVIKCLPQVAMSACALMGMQTPCPFALIFALKELQVPQLKLNTWRL